jgi:hypothetical protein
MVLCTTFSGITADEFEAATLRDLSTVAVTIENLAESTKKLGLNQESLQTDVELRLRLAGLNVVQSVTAAQGGCYLYVNVNAHETSGGAYAVAIRVELKQTAILQRNRSITAYGATTWHRATVGVTTRAQTVRDEVKDLTDHFLNDWLSVNRK